jgi:hypothetical protein
MVELDEVSNCLRKLLQLLAAHRLPRGRGHWRRRSPTAAPSAGLHKEKASAGAESEHGQPTGHVEGALVILAPEEADGSLLTMPGEVFAWLAVVCKHLSDSLRRRLRTAQAWVRLRELVRKAANRRFDLLGSALWLQALDYRRKREAGDEPAIIVRLMHPQVMGNEWGVGIAVFPSETASSVKAYALGLLACGDLIPGRLMSWTSARIRRVRARAGKLQCGRVCTCAWACVRECIRACDSSLRASGAAGDVQAVL